MTDNSAKDNPGKNTEIRELVIQNDFGLHVRPASAFVQLSSGFKCDITLKKDELMVDGKSIMQVLMLGAVKGTKIVLEASGEDAHQAADALEELVNSKFGEI